MILAGIHSSSAEIKRFWTEAQAIARLQHPGIVQVFEIGEHDGKPFMALEFCSGGSLDAKLAKNPLPAKQAAMLVKALAEAVEAAHQAKVIHRDLKPANVLLTEKGEPKVTDFGLAKKLDEQGATRTGSVMGTPSYMPPEQAEGKKDVGPTADVYALGAILYECLASRPPFRAATPWETIQQLLTKEAVPVRQLNAQAPVDLETVCAKCLEKDPKKRYPTALELADDLGRYLAGLPTRARPVGALERGWRWCRRNAVVASLLAGLVLTLLSGVAVATLLAVRASISAELARDQAKRADDEAEKADARAKEAKLAEGRAAQKATEAEEEREKERQQRERAEMLAYVGQIYRAQNEWDHGDAKLAWNHLEACQWNLRGWEHRYLTNTFSKNDFGQHGSAVTSVAFSPDGKSIVSGSMDKTLKIWDAEKATETFILKGHTEGVYCVAFSPDGKRIVSGSADGTLKVWDAAKGTVILTIDGHTHNVYGVAFSPDSKRIVSGSWDKMVKVWDAEKGTEILTLNAFAGVHCVGFSPDGKRIVSSFGNTLRLSDSANGNEILIVKRERIGDFCVAFSPDGNRIVSGLDDNTVKVWDADKGNEILTLKGHTDWVTSVAFNPDGKRIISGSLDKTLKVWDAEKGTEIRTLKGHTAGVTSP